MRRSGSSSRRSGRTRDGPPPGAGPPGFREGDVAGRACHACGCRIPPGETSCPGCLLKVALDLPTGASLPGATIPGMPARIGPYELLRELGEGGMGTVYLAEQREPLRRTVALKLTKAGLESPSELSRFDVERAALTRLDHPGIARIYDAGLTEAGRPYFVMEYVEGRPLTGFCDEERLSIPERLEIFLAVCGAVQHAHQVGIIHRDLKPSNILVARQGGVPVPKIIDFGLAKAMGVDLATTSVHTMKGEFLGTPEYMSPEQAEGAGRVDSRTDIYSLGVLLYELLTGMLPFEPETLRRGGLVAAARVLREEEPPRPSERVGALPGRMAAAGPGAGAEARALRRVLRGDLDGIVMRAIEKQPARRYSSASELAADIRRHRNHEVVTARPPVLGYRLRKLVRRNRAAVAAAALIALTLLGGLVATTWQAIRATRAEGTARELARAEAQQRREAEAATRAAAERLWEAQVARARASRKSGRPGQRLDCLDALARAAAIRIAPELRNDAIGCMALPDLRLLETADTPWAAPTFFDGTLGLAALWDKTEQSVRVRRVADGRELLAWPSGAGRPIPSPDGAHVVVSIVEPAAPRIEVWNVGAAAPVLSLPDENPGFVQVAFRQDGGEVALTRDGGRVHIHDLRAGRGRTIDAGPHPTDHLALHPARPLLATASGARAGLSFVDTITGERLPSPELPELVASLAWSPDGTILAVGAYDNDVHLWHVPENRWSRLSGHVATPALLAFDRTGEMIASSAYDGTTRLWAARNGRTVITMPGLADRFSVLDDRLAVNAPGTSIFEMVRPWEGRTLDALPSAVGWDSTRNLALGPDGRLVLAATIQGLWLWDLATGRRIDDLGFDRNMHVLMLPSGEEAITSGQQGVFRWPLRGRPGALGPPRRLLGAVRQHGWMSTDGRLLLVVLDAGEARVLRLDRPEESWVLTGHDRMASAEISPDGHWIATAAWQGRDVKIWNAHTRELERVLRAGTAAVAWSPEGRFLVTSLGKENVVWDARSWEVVQRFEREDQGDFPGPIAFSPDGSLLALAHSRTAIQLVDPGTGETFAIFEPPDWSQPTAFRFTPDGARLVVGGRPSHVLHVWDLALIRRRLREMGLDWERAPLPALPPIDRSGPPLVVQVDLGDLAPPRPVETLRP